MEEKSIDKREWAVSWGKPTPDLNGCSANEAGKKEEEEEKSIIIIIKISLLSCLEVHM
jgi:hypothetical protein